MMSRAATLTFIGIALCHVQTAFGFNLFIDRDFGVNVLHWGDVFANDALYFIKDDVPFAGTLGNNLLHLITVQTTHRLKFTWNTDPDEIVTYKWAFNSTDLRVLARPYLSINHTGIVPREEVFFFIFPCTGVNPRTEQAGILLDYSVYGNINASVASDILDRNSTASLPSVVGTPKLNISLRLSTRVDCLQLGPIDGKKDESDSQPLWAIGVVFGCIIAIVLISVVAFLLYRQHKEKTNVSTLERELTVLRDAQESSSARYMDVYSDSSGSISGSVSYKETLSMRMHNASRKASRPKSDMMDVLKENWFEELEDCIVEYSQIQFGEELGKGAFGFVYKGTLTAADDPSTVETVALKTMKTLDSVSDMSRFLSEGIVMKDFRHRNVMGLTGVCFPEEDPPIIILPFMANGDLHSFLKKRRGSASSMDTMTDNMLSLDRLMQFVNDIARGMDYLSRQNFVHRDLAARNCMLDEDFVVKIGDFGLAKDMHEELYYRLGTPTKLPVKWLAIESLNDQVFTLQTDVWAFGVTMWEILSLGMQPYPGVANHELTELLLKGHRLQKPAICTHDLFEIMSSCWLVEPHNRPTFSQLVMMLERLDGGSYSSNVDDPDGYENMSPMSKTPSVSYNRDTLDERETLLSPTGYTIMNLDSSPRPRMKDPTVTSPDDSDNYLPMLLKSSALTDGDQAFVTAPEEEEEGGNYLPMSLKLPTSSDDKQNGIKSPERVDDYVSRTDGHETATKRQRTVSTASGKERKEVDATGDDEYMRMSVNLARADVSKPDVVEEQDADEYMRMTVQNGKRDVNRELGDADDKYVRMTSKSDLTTNGFVNGKVGPVVNDDGEGTLL
ncbi:tyrosine-protein kinase receptor TYRO3-like isoform X2 [Corticium candelabrum]|nr:tyrosine-protein kinase receptor TYRO3-like isoform X2 [Corticium candelabrum]